MLESMARKYTSPYCDVLRAKIILLANEGLSNDVIASRLDTPRQIVSKWRKRFAIARLPGLEAQPRGGRKARFSPPVSSFRLRHSPASFLTPSGSHCLGSRLRKSASTLFPKAWSPRSAALLYGAGSAAMPFAPGNIEAGSFPVIRTLPQKPDPSLIFTNVSGRALHWVPTIMSSAQTKRPVFKPAAENNRRCRWRPIARSTSSMSTSAWVPGPTWQLGMSIEQESSAAAKSKVELLPSIGLWAKSWGKSLINLLAASFGSWTTVLLIEGRRLPTAYVTGGQT
jgi:hypothetical protein